MVTSHFGTWQYNYPPAKASELLCSYMHLLYVAAWLGVACTAF